MKQSLKLLLPLFVLAIFFILATYLGLIFGPHIETYIVQNEYTYIGYATYVALMIIATVVAPLSTLPLMPIAVSIWGSLRVAILSIIGWSLGAIWAFYISRRFGMPIVQRFVSKEKIAYINSKIPEDKNLLISIILLRVVIPVDILSYALGIFPRVTWRAYTIGSVIGVIPFSFIFAYLGGLSVEFQIIGLIIIVPILVFFWVQKKPKILS